MTTAEFFDQPLDLYAVGNGHRVDVSSVKANGTSLGTVLSARNQQGTVMEPRYEGGRVGIVNGLQWDVAGASGIPSFLWNDNSPYPAFTGSLPDTLWRNQGLTFDLTGSQIKDADSAAIMVEGANVVARGIRLPGRITFSPQELTNATGYIMLWFGKYTTATFGGKRFVSVKAKEVAKYLPVK
jgi:hypothetical protein